MSYFEKTLKAFHAAARSAAQESDSLEEWKGYGFESFEKWNETRNRCYKDLFWFAKDILGYDLVEAHRLITDEFFIKKDPDKKIHELDYVNRSRLILFPRGGFKSSIDEADTVQWIVCYPNIRIGLMTGTEDLAISFIKNIKGFFQIAENSKLTQFQMLFYEHCVRATKREEAAVFTTRARTDKKLKEATLEALALMASTSGFHYDVGKFDDVVTNRNSGPGTTSEARKTVYESLRFAAALIEPFGYKFYIGTPYDSDDAWSILQAKNKKLKVFRRPAITIKDYAKQKSFDQLQEEDVELLFPCDAKGFPRLTLEFLKEEYATDEYIFSCNYMLDPQRTVTVRFTEKMIRDRIVLENQLPQPGTYRLFSAWDFADSTGKNSDYSVGVVGMVDVFGRLYIIEIVRGRFSPSELAFRVADLAARHRVERIYIEKSPGSTFLHNDIMRELSRQGYGECPSPEWFPVDNQKGAKVKRAEMLESLLTHGHIWFSININIMDDVINEFLKFKPDAKRKDDIIDAIAHLTRVMPARIEPPESDIERTKIVYEILAQKQLQDMYFGVREVVEEKVAPALPMEYDGYPISCPGCGFFNCICGGPVITQ